MTKVFLVVSHNHVVGTKIEEAKWKKEDAAQRAKELEKAWGSVFYVKEVEVD